MTTRATFINSLNSRLFAIRVFKSLYFLLGGFLYHRVGLRVVEVSERVKEVSLFIVSMSYGKFCSNLQSALFRKSTHLLTVRLRIRVTSLRRDGLSPSDRNRECRPLKFLIRYFTSSTEKKDETPTDEIWIKKTGRNYATSSGSLKTALKFDVPFILFLIVFDISSTFVLSDTLITAALFFLSFNKSKTS